VKAQHEARALALVSLSGTLAAALLAIAAFAGGKSGGPALPLGSRLAAVAAVLGFLGAVYFALEILRPARHRRARTDEIRQIIDKEMRGLEADVLWRISMLRVDLLESYRVQNLRKARGIHRVVGCEIVALQGLAVAVTIVLLRAHTAWAVLLCGLEITVPWMLELRRSKRAKAEEATAESMLGDASASHSLDR
jgi:hypothetical protein